MRGYRADLMTKEPLKTVALAIQEPEAVQKLNLFLQQHFYVCTGVAHSALEASALVQLYKPHVMILDLDLPGSKAMEMLQHILAQKTTAVIVTRRETCLELYQQAMDLGAAGFLLAPFDAPQVSAVLLAAWHRFQKEFALHGEIDALKDGLETRKLIDRAKGILIAERGISEPEAYRLLQKMSQDKRVSMKEVCRAVDQIQLVVGLKTKNKTAL